MGNVKERENYDSAVPLSSKELFQALLDHCFLFVFLFFLFLSDDDDDKYLTCQHQLVDNINDLLQKTVSRWRPKQS